MTPDLPGSAPTGRRVRIRHRRVRRVPAAVNPTPPGAPVQHAAAAVGAFLVLVGLLGFLPGPTVHFDDIRVSDYSTAMLLGLFSVSVLHNVIHLLVGAAGVVLARNRRLARAFLLLAGVFLVALAALGHGVTADAWLRLVLGVGMIGLAFLRAT
jgi:Domain of unknown function (DUF4383)